MSDYEVHVYIDEDDYDVWLEQCRIILQEKNISGLTEFDIPKNMWEDGFTPEESVEEMEVYWGIEEDDD